MMLTTQVGRGSASEAVRMPLRCGAIAALLTVGLAACGATDDTGIEPELPGSIAVTTETSGFQQDDSYELLVDGVSAGTIGANDQVMIEDLESGSYQLALNDVADNCIEEAATAIVTSAATADVSLTVLCSAGLPTPYSLRANRDRPDLETGVITECTFGLCPTNEGWDVYVEFDSGSDPQAIVRQNATTGVQLAHVVGKTLATISESDVTGATFSADPVDEPFDTGRVVLVRTDTGAVYGFDNPVESTILLTITFDALLLVAGP